MFGSFVISICSMIRFLRMSMFAMGPPCGNKCFALYYNAVLRKMCCNYGENQNKQSALINLKALSHSSRSWRSVIILCALTNKLIHVYTYVYVYTHVHNHVYVYQSVYLPKSLRYFVMPASKTSARLTPHSLAYASMQSTKLSKVKI